MKNLINHRNAMDIRNFERHTSKRKTGSIRANVLPSKPKLETTKTTKNSQYEETCVNQDNTSLTKVFFISTKRIWPWYRDHSCVLLVSPVKQG